MRWIGIAGGGAWGTALGAALVRAGREVLIWAREPDVVEQINRHHENHVFLPGICLDPAIRATAALRDLGAMDAIVLVPPAQHLRAVLGSLAPHLGAAVPLIVGTKGIEQGSRALMSEIIAEVAVGRPLAVLSGPTFASEVARGLPTAVTLATRDATLGQRLVDALGSRLFRPYLANDVIGAEIAGAVKNVVAIACGIVIGRGLGENARAAVITRGLAEIGRLVVAKGGQAETLMGLAGIGDLALTCASLQSRNTALGHALGSGKSLAEYRDGRRSVAEGLTTAAAVTALARSLGVDMPICEAVDAVINHGMHLETAIDALLSRPFKPERPLPPSR
jgi:glycerol-3-phosphate dehydrogenase (NAD(P)+)